MIIELGAKDLAAIPRIERVVLPVPPENVTVELAAKDVIIAFVPVSEMPTGPP